MPAPLVGLLSGQMLFVAVLMTLGSLFFVILAAWFAFWRKPAHGDRLSTAVCLVLAIVFAAQAVLFSVIAYDRYLIEGRQYYSYRLVIRGNATLREAIVVPIPTDETLLANLRVDSGVANWSVVDTIHGRGLYVSFLGPAELGADFTEYSPSGPTHDDTPTMGNATYGCLWSAHFFLDGPSSMVIDLNIGNCFLSAAAYPGWGEAEFNCCPPEA